MSSVIWIGVSIRGAASEMSAPAIVVRTPMMSR
jgi:hypothetical protein